MYNWIHITTIKAHKSLYIYICLHFNRILIECFLVGDYNVYAYSESEHLISEYGDEHDTEEDY